MGIRFGIIGAGFTGAVLAREFAENGIDVEVFDQRNHIGGNCHTYLDAKTGVMVHAYGPHIFHTDSTEVWDYVNRFGNFKNYTNRVKSCVDGQVYSLPINLHTINQFYRNNLSPAEAREFIARLGKADIDHPVTFEEQALKFIGEDLYKAFFYGYTKKQWGIEPSLLPASILKRLPVRFNYNDNYFFHKYQGMPEYGYTQLISNILNHEKINVTLGVKVDREMKNDFHHLFYSGPIDEWFEYTNGMLAYRTLDFEKIYYDGDFQGCAVMNYGDEKVPYTRITEHKHFSPWLDIEKSVVFKEFSRLAEKNDIPYYPVRLVDDKSMLKDYIEKAKSEKKVSFLGRLGTYRYLDMDVTIEESLKASKAVLANIENIPSFFNSPL